MNIKFANEIVEEMNARGRILVPEGYVTGEEFEKWMCAAVENVAASQDDSDGEVNSAESTLFR